MEEPFDDVYDEKFDLDDAVEVHGVDPAEIGRAHV